ncbi:hypothetical protein QS306_04400 [Paraburkholderia bonniea]|uniref:hypothetical protein n=1 Tax=Paraburkholderia bonniea TaxID=2152891 RepID=UPI0012920871|nr:hypothetical protein [Paraburkholderia bonniea]WJF90910.1 hypothetical protein QS306_04400 [Paraburkholderia bonniea]WJF94224.1 hypothetical protein QS308_04405 [Paraburkholderia bonniea]
MKMFVPYLVAAALGAGLINAAEARVSIDVGIGLPVFPVYPAYAPPPPPVYYAPPPVVYGPPPVVVGGYYGYPRPYWRHGYYRAHGYYGGGYYGRGNYRHW